MYIDAKNSMVDLRNCLWKLIIIGTSKFKVTNKK